jgi:hypothetical protein
VEATRSGGDLNRPGLLETPGPEPGRQHRLGLLTVVRQLQFHRRHVVDRFRQPAMIEPVDLFQDGVLDGLQMAPRPAMMNDLRLAQPNGWQGRSATVARRSLTGRKRPYGEVTDSGRSLAQPSRIGISESLPLTDIPGPQTTDGLTIIAVNTTSVVGCVLTYINYRFASPACCCRDVVRLESTNRD